jgi:hypothetical protein
MTINIPRDDSYNSYDNFADYSYSLVKYLMDHDEMIWKLLKYSTPTAWNESDLTKAQKGALIYDGSDDASLFRVFLDMGQPDVNTTENCILRISPHSIFPENRVVGTCNFIFETYANYKVNHLSNYKTRLDMIMQRLLATFNGATIEGMLGKMYFDRMGSEAIRAEWAGQIPYKGRWVIMSNKVG